MFIASAPGSEFEVLSNSVIMNITGPLIFVRHSCKFFISLNIYVVK